jgi:ribosomal protein L11 methyltransferase
MSDLQWLEISLTVNGELAEAVAEALARYIPSGVGVESTAIIPDPDGEGYPADTVRVFGYLPVDTGLEDTRQKIEQALWYLGCISPLPPAQFQTIPHTNWMEAWKQHYRPIPIGQRLIIVPAWLEPPTDERVPIRIDPGMAFGTGTHPTTQMCLEILEDLLNPQRPGSLTGLGTVIDIGCGSGILSVAAVKLEAALGHSVHALGVDIDPQAVTASRENAEVNGVSGSLEVGIGSVDEVRSGAFSISQAPVVFANILAPVLIRLFKDGLGELLTPGGIAILSGILEEQASGVLQAAQAHGLKLVERRQIDDWVALAVQK